MNRRDKTEGRGSTRDAEVLLRFENQVLKGSFREYTATRRNNLFASIQKFSKLWNCFGLLDEIWMREFSDLEQVSDLSHFLPGMLFVRAHAHFRIALDLAFSGCIPEAAAVSRGGIESVVHARHILAHPELAEVWLKKGDSPCEEKAYRHAFEQEKRTRLYQGLEPLYEYWTTFSEWGSHSTVSSMAMNSVIEQQADGVRGWLHYFVTDPEKLERFIVMLLDAAGRMEAALFESFKTRLNLDPDLLRMRHSLARRRSTSIERLRRAIIRGGMRSGL